MAVPNTVLHARLYLPDGSTFEDTASIGFTVQSQSDVGIPPAEMATWITDLINEAVAGQTASLGTYLSPEITRATNGCPIEIYDVSNTLNGTPSGSPVRVTPLTLVALGDPVALPADMAAVVAYRSAYGIVLEKGRQATIPSQARAIEEEAPATHST